MGPSLSSDQHSVIAPVRGTRPKVGRRPVTPQRMLGATMLPSVSLPIANPTESRRRGSPRTGARARGALLQQPGIHRLAAEPDIVQRQRSETELRDEHRAGLVQAPNHGGIFDGTRSLEGLGAVGGADTGGVEQVLCRPRECRAAARDSYPPRSPHRRASPGRAPDPRQRDHAAQRWIEPSDPLQ